MNSEFDFFTMWGRMTPAILALVPAIFGIFLFFFGRSTNRLQVKTFGYVVLAIGVVIGIFAVIQLSDPLYGQFHDVGPKSQMLFYAILGIPLLTAIGLYIYDRITGSAVTRGL